MPKQILYGTIIYGSILLLLGLLVWQATPAPTDQEVRGVGLGRPQDPAGIVYLSGRHLDCAPTTLSAFTTRCTIDIAGQPLELFARRNAPTDPNQLGGSCEAHYAGQTWPCRMGSRHVHVHWFAYVDEPLGLTPNQLESLRSRYLIENIPEVNLVWGIGVIGMITAIVSALAMASVLPQRRGWQWLGQAGAALCVGLLAGGSTLIAALSLTSGLWD